MSKVRSLMSIHLKKSKAAPNRREAKFINRLSNRSSYEAYRLKHASVLRRKK